MPMLLIHGRPVFVDDVGQGPPILAIHGFPLHGEMWKPQVDGLPHYRWIVPDFPGFRFSPPSGTDIITMEDLVDVSVQILDALHVTEPVILMGLSMGGYVCFRFWGHFPQRVGAMVLCDTMPQIDSADQISLWNSLADDVLAKGTHDFVNDQVKNLVSPQTLENNPEVVNQLHRMMDSIDRLTVSAGMRGLARRPDSTGLLESISVPTLALAGADDQITPVDEMQQWIQQIPTGQSAVIENAGHLANLEQPELVNQTIDQFLKSLSSI